MPGMEITMLFSHIYLEEEIKNNARAEKILSKFPNANVIEIGHYKDVFCRKRQDVLLQGQTPALILAKDRGRLLYPGAAVCQNFGREHFYYTSCVMNCIYDCEYCYLKGMYPSGNLVVFVNLEDIFAKVEEALQRQDVYLCISYDTDLLALEKVTGYVGEWIEFARRHSNLCIEIRTKCAGQRFYAQWAPAENVIFAFTLSPQAVIEQWEHRTASLQQRLEGARAALERGFPVRFCFDPMIYCPDWKMQYGEMLVQVLGQIDMERITDVSVGSFRIPQDYLKKMRKMLPDSAVVQFPFENDNGVCHYPDGLMEEMERFLTDRLAEKIPAEKIFRWKDQAF